MRLESLRIRGLGPFRDEQQVDLTHLGDARVVAVCGSNGAGKSTLNELFPGALYRQCPTRGSLQSLATERESFVEVRIVNGAPYTVRQTCDAVSGKGESLVMDGDGTALVESGKRKDFDAWATKHLPPPEVFLASQFASQGSGGVLAMKPGERKAVLLRALGVERLESLAERARTRKSSASAQLDTLVARLNDERERGGDVAALDAELQGVRSSLQAAEQELAGARQALEDSRAAKAAYDAAMAERGRVAEQRAQIGRTMATLKEKNADGETRIRNNRGLVDRAAEIRAAVERVKELDAVIADAQVAYQRAVGEERSTRDAVERLRAEAAAAQKRVTDASERAERAEKRLADRERIDAAAASIDGLREQLATAQANESEAENVLEQRRSKRIAGAEDRIEALREGLTEIAYPTDIALLQDVAVETLAKDDEAIELARTLPGDIAAAEQELKAARDRRAVALRALGDAEKLAARAADLESAEQEIAEARQAAHDAGQEIGRALAEAQGLSQVADGHADAARKRMAQINAAGAEREQAERIAKDAEPLARAEARIAELEARATELRAELEQARTDLAAMPEPSEALPEPAGVAAALSRAEGLERSNREAHARVTVLEQSLGGARASAARVEELEGQRSTLSEELADWTRLAADLGRDGLQALEIDCAGPEISETANTLLHGCFGTRFTVSLDTTKLSADGKKQLEGCEITVLDTLRGREGPAERLSGGERVIVSEALSLALTVVACRRAGVERPTLVRDESGAALDPENGRAYVTMLRRAADMVGADRVLFVSHSAELQELADARIEIADGKVTLTQ